MENLNDIAREAVAELQKQRPNAVALVALGERLKADPVFELLTSIARAHTGFMANSSVAYQDVLAAEELARAYLAPSPDAAWLAFRKAFGELSHDLTSFLQVALTIKLMRERDDEGFEPMNDAQMASTYLTKAPALAVQLRAANDWLKAFEATR